MLNLCQIQCMTYFIFLMLCEDAYAYQTVSESTLTGAYIRGELPAAGLVPLPQSATRDQGTRSSEHSLKTAGLLCVQYTSFPWLELYESRTDAVVRGKRSYHSAMPV